MALKEEKEFCYQWKAKGQCERGDKCSFRLEGDEREKPTQKTAPPSEPPTQRNRSASRKGSSEVAVQRLVESYLHQVTL